LTVIITTNEPVAIRNLFLDKLEIPMPFDILLYTNSGPIPIERKRVPGDLTASVEDGRLSRELIAMEEVSERRIVLLHGRIEYDKSGFAVVGYRKRIPLKGWNRKGINNLIRTLEHVEGVFIETAETNRDLVDVVGEIQEYFDKLRHLSTKSRPKIEGSWGNSRVMRIIHFYSGIPGIAAIRARELYKVFSNPIDLYQASVSDILNIDGFGKTLASHTYNFLRCGCEKGSCRICG